MQPSERCEPKSAAEMSEDVVVQLLQLFDQHGIEVVVDGGWGVDALLGKQTRVHADVDIALEHKESRNSVQCGARTRVQGCSP
jgi:lincosamide nucleotidyltransferase A/C/D/E